MFLVAIACHCYLSLVCRTGIDVFEPQFPFVLSNEMHILSFNFKTIIPLVFQCSVIQRSHDKISGRHIGIYRSGSSLVYLTFTRFGQAVCVCVRTWHRQF